MLAGAKVVDGLPHAPGDVEKTVKELKGRGVTFEHCDMPGMTLEGDIHVADGMKLAWFKDPDVNIHGIAEE